MLYEQLERDANKCEELKKSEIALKKEANELRRQVETLQKKKK